MNLNGCETDGVPAPSDFELGTWVSDDDGPPYAELRRLYEAARTLILDWQTRNDALTAERDGYRAVAEQRAAQISALAQEVERLREENGQIADLCDGTLSTNAELAAKVERLQGLVEKSRDIIQVAFSVKLGDGKLYAFVQELTAALAPHEVEE